MSRFAHSRFGGTAVLRRRITLLAVVSLAVLSGCGGPVKNTSQPFTTVTPSSTGTPNSVVSFNDFEFVSVQSTGQIFTYNISSGVQVAAVAPYSTPCSDPSGMAVTSIGSSNIMAVVCFDTGSLITLTVHADGSLTPLGSVSGLAAPYPGIVLDGTNLFIPIFGQSGSSNGGVAKVSIASPANPVITATTTLASPLPGAIVNPGYLTVAAGNIYVAAGSESDPQSATSTVQVLNEAGMTLVGSPLVVPHSPQQIAVQGSVAYVTFYDAAQLESIDISAPAGIQPLQVLSLATANSGCSPEPVALNGNTAYVGCSLQGDIEQVDVTDPANMQLSSNTIAGIVSPQRLAFAGNYLLATSSVSGGKVYLIVPGTH